MLYVNTLLTTGALIRLIHGKHVQHGNHIAVDLDTGSPAWASPLLPQQILPVHTQDSVPTAAGQDILKYVNPLIGTVNGGISDVYSVKNLET